MSVTRKDNLSGRFSSTLERPPALQTLKRWAPHTAGRVYHASLGARKCPVSFSESLKGCAFVL